MYDEHGKQYTVIDGVNIIRRLEKYANDGHLKDSTLFCTFNISNLYTMLPQAESIDILRQFLRCCAGNYGKNILVSAVQKLAHLALKENAFVCNNKFYRQVIADANPSHPNIQLQAIIGKSVLFLEARLSNEQGALSTSVYHKPSAEPYVLPFLSDHPR